MATDRGLEPELEKGCNSCLIAAEPIPAKPGISSHVFLNRTNGSFLRKDSLLFSNYPRTPYSDFLPSRGYFSKPEGESCHTKMAYPASLAMLASATNQIFHATMDTPAYAKSSNNMWLVRVPNVLYATAYGAGLGLTTCLLQNFAPFKKNPKSAYFTAGFATGALWGTVQSHGGGVGRGLGNGLALGIMWVVIKEAWEKGLPGLMPLDPYGDMDWKVNHIPRAY